MFNLILTFSLIGPNAFAYDRETLTGRLAGNLLDVGLTVTWRFAPPPLATDLRRLRFLRRLAHQADRPRSQVERSLESLAFSLERAGLDPIAWLKWNAPFSARGLIDEIEAEARAQRVRVRWGSDRVMRAWRQGDEAVLALEFHAAARRPVAIMLFHLLHELAHVNRRPGPRPGMTLDQYETFFIADQLDEEIRVRVMEPAFLARVRTAGLRIDDRDVSPESPLIWAAWESGAPREELRKILEAKYGSIKPSILLGMYLQTYAHHDAADLKRAMNDVGADRVTALRRVIAASPAFAVVPRNSYVGYVDEILDCWRGMMNPHARRRARRILLRLGSSARVTTASRPLESTCASLL